MNYTGAIDARAGNGAGIIQPKLYYYLLFVPFFLPDRLLSQALPFFFLFAAIVVTNGSHRKQTPLTTPVLLLLLVSLCSFAVNRYDPFKYAIALITYFGGLCFFFFGYVKGYSIRIEGLVKAFQTVVLLEVLLGTLQVFIGIGGFHLDPFKYVGSAGDNFTGTLLNPGKTAQILAAQIVLALILTLAQPYGGRSSSWAFILILLTGLALDGTLHIIVCFLVAMSIFYRKLAKRYIRWAAIVAGGLSVTYLLFKDDYSYGFNILSQILDGVLQPRKFISMADTIMVLPTLYPWAPFIGIGIGNYSSYAGLVSSGMIPSAHWLDLGMNQAQRDFIWLNWNWLLLQKPFNEGMMNQPWSTFQSLYGELGSFGVLVFLGIFRRIFQLLRSLKMYKPDLNNGLRFASIFLLITFFFDNYFEDPRIIGIYFLFIGVYFAGARAANLALRNNVKSEKRTCTI